MTVTQHSQPLTWREFVTGARHAVDNMADNAQPSQRDTAESSTHESYMRWRTMVNSLGDLAHHNDPTPQDARDIAAAVSAALSYAALERRSRSALVDRRIVATRDRTTWLAGPISVESAPTYLSAVIPLPLSPLRYVPLSLYGVSAGTASMFATAAAELAATPFVAINGGLATLAPFAAFSLGVLAGNCRSERKNRRIPEVDWEAFELAVRRTCDAEDVSDARAAFEMIEQAWLDYITDPEAYFLRRPLLHVDSHPATANYQRARYTAKELLDSHPGDVDSDTAATIDAAVAAAVAAWDLANSEALAAGTDPFSSSERAALRRSQQLIALIADPALADAARDHHVRELRNCLDKLTSCPASATALAMMPQLAQHITQLGIAARS